MNFLVVVTPPSIYYGCSTGKTFWEEKFTGKENLFLTVDMQNCGQNTRISLVVKVRHLGHIITV